MISVARRPTDQKCRPTFAAADPVAPATDDRPFPYFRGGGIPSLYLLALTAILLASLVSVRLVAGPFRTMRPYLDLFFMGAAFLLLETKSVTTFALLFGTTWIVNSIVFAGVLLAVLLAVEVTRRFRTPALPLLYVGIAGALVLAYVVPNASLLALPLLPRLVAAISLPSLRSFSRTSPFRSASRPRTTRRAHSGSTCSVRWSGAASSTSLLFVGFRNLLIVAGLLYLAAFVLMPRRRLREI